MTVTYQHNVLSTEYNGWENYETWNVALWINNTENLYHLAMKAGDYETFLDWVGNATTGDGVKFNDPRVNVIQINSDVFDFWLTLKTHTLTNTLMLNFIPYSIRRPFYYVFDLIACSDFRSEEFGRIFDAYEYEQSTQILGFINYLGITGQLDLPANFDLFADVETLEQAIEKWTDYQDLMNTSTLA